MELVEKALAFAEWAHEGQFRKGGQNVPYITHPKDVCENLRAHGVTDEVTLAAALLHDTVEDCKKKGVTEQLIEQEFGAEVAGVVMEVTDDPATKTKTKDAQIAKAPTMSYPAKLVKLSDKTKNMWSLVHTPPGWKPESVRAYVETSKKVVAALGHVHEALEAEFHRAAAAALATVA